MKKHDESYYAYKPIKSNPVILDFTGCRYLGVVHKILKEAFGLPEYYGENWDALWDCLRYRFVGDGLIIVKVYGTLSLPDDFEHHTQIMLKVFEDVSRENSNVVFEMMS